MANDLTLEATGPSGAVANYEITATDDNGPPQVTCSPPDGSTFPLGKTRVNCTATDTKTGQTRDAAFFVTVQDTKPPTVTVPGDITAEATGPNGASVTYSGVSATDIVSGSLTPNCSKASGSNFTLGTTSVTCSATDGSGNNGSASFNVTVKDTTPPVVVVPADITVDATGSGGATVTYSGVSATDAVTPSLTPTCDKPSGSTFPVGKTTVTCSATDGAGNTGKASFTITVRDRTPPTITVPADMTVEATGPSGATVNFTVTASDNVSPSCSPASGSTFPLGKTTVNCTATDASGNRASASFKVTVQDTKPPTINVPDSVTAEATSSAGATVNYTVTASDTVSGSITPSCDRASGSVFPVGSTTVKCTATDGAGNKATGSFTVTVRDTKGPTFSNVPNDITVEANGPSGSVVRYDTPTAVDSVGGAVPASCSPASGSTFRVGSSAVICTASDSRGNSGSASFTVYVLDRTAPVLTVPAAISVSSSGADSVPASNAAIAAFLGGATARDIVDGSVTVTNDAPGTFAVGTTTVSFSAKDKSGNASTGRSTVTVTKAAVAPAKPVDRVPPDDVRGLSVKAGDRTITLAWQRPLAPDFDHVVVTRSSKTSPEKQVYSGPARRYVDRGLTNGVDYRYVVVSYDRAGNRAAGIAAVAAPKVEMLVSPADGARVTAPPLLRWRAVAGASYYNLQLFRGRTKILTVWPTATQLQLTSAWRYSGHTEHLAPGYQYRWYVFPGFGPRSAEKYGAVLGPSTFVLGKRR